MNAYSGHDFTLNLGAMDANPEIVGGMRTTEFTLINDLIESTHVESDGARMLLTGAGVQALKISAQGLYTHSVAEQKIFTAAISRNPLRYSLFFGDGQKIEGDFMVSNYHRSGDEDAEEIYHLTLESTGKLRVVTA